jgi:hypothetical protein
MHGQRELLASMWFGSDGREMVYVRFDFAQGADADVANWEIELQVHEHTVTLRHQDRWLCVSDPACPAAMDTSLEVAVPFYRVGLKNWDLLRLRATVRQGGMVSATLPERGFCEFYL